MKSKTVTRYSCDFCRKTAYRRSTMAAHESGCTNNPDRVCKLCERMAVTQASLEALAENATQVDKLRQVAQGCPACMLAGIRAYNRENGPEEYLWIDYQAEHRRYWEAVNELELEQTSAVVM